MPEPFYSKRSSLGDILLLLRKTSDKVEISLLRINKDDGQCAIDIYGDPNVPQPDLSNFLQIADAASAVLRNCVQLRQPSIGGVVKRLGTY